SAAHDTRRSSRGTVKEISARPPADAGSFCTIMSTFTFACASASKMRAAAPGASGTPISVRRASEVECVTAVMSGCSIVSSSATTKRGDVPAHARDTLKARDEDDAVLLERGLDALRAHVHDQRLRVRLVGHDPGLGPGQRDRSMAEVVDRHGAQRTGDPLAGR